jgi:hypothetical protein
MIDPKHLVRYVIRPVLQDLELWSEAAEQLVLGTACVESECGHYLHQLAGPALGIYQMEPATHDDIWGNYLDFQPDISKKVEKWIINIGDNLSDEMIGNLYYATAMCRIHYLRVPEEIPEDLSAQAEYWLKYYNTELGKGTTYGYLNNWYRLVGSNVFV